MRLMPLDENTPLEEEYPVLFGQSHPASEDQDAADEAPSSPGRDSTPADDTIEQLEPHHEQPCPPLPPQWPQLKLEEPVEPALRPLSVLAAELDRSCCRPPTRGRKVGICWGRGGAERPGRSLRVLSAGGVGAAAA